MGSGVIKIRQASVTDPDTENLQELDDDAGGQTLEDFV
jgi:hypothetical protein